MNPLLPFVHPFAYRQQSGKWKFVLTSDLRITFPTKYWGNHEFADDAGRVWARTEGRDWIILAGYAWDGASFAINFAWTIAASAWHDAVGQFRHLLCLAADLTGAEWNQLFADIIRSRGGKKTAAVYHFGLTLGNPFYQALGKLFGSKSTGSCLIHKLK